MFVPKLIVCLRDYSWRQFQRDTAAGIVVGLVAMPLAMAFAIASGVTPERGLYTAIVAGFIVSCLGGSRVQIGGPTGAFIVIVAGIVAKQGYEGLIIATLMAGLILVVMGFGRFGELVKYIPYPVTTGFTSGIAVIIFSGQVKDFLGLQMSHVPGEFLAKCAAVIKALPSAMPSALGIGLLTTVIIWKWPKAWQRVPSPLVALLIATITASVFHLPVETIGSRFGGIPQSLPTFSWPTFSWTQIKVLFPDATTIALLAAIESLLSAVVADGMINGRHKSNMELVAQGVANIGSALFGGIPATGAIARTATNVKNGGRTPIAGIVHALTLLVILLLAGRFATHVPLAALAGILVVVSYDMSEWRSFRTLLSGPRSDVVVLVTTFLLTILVDLTVAVEVGMVLAAFLFMRHMAELTRIKVVQMDPANGEAEGRTGIPAGVQVYSAHGLFFFGAAHKLIETLRIVGQVPRALVLDMTDVLHMDASGLHVLEQIARECRSRGTAFLIVGIHSQPLFVLQGTELYTRLGEKSFQPTLATAFSSLS